MIATDEKLKRECLELLIEQNPMLDKDSILALYNNIEKNCIYKQDEKNIKSIIENHLYK